MDLSFELRRLRRAEEKVARVSRGTSSEEDAQRRVWESVQQEVLQSSDPAEAARSAHSHAVQHVMPRLAGSRLIHI